MKNEVIKFVNGSLQLDVTVSPDKETVWLSQKQMAELFDKDRKTITRHIQNIFKSNELDEFSVCSYFEHTASDGKTYKTQYYNLDMIISVGYRVNSKQGILFRKWASSILKDYMVKGYAINQKRLDVLNKTIEIQSKMLATTLNIEEREVLNVVEAYSNALSLLDDYDHGCISKPKGEETVYQLTYEECRKLIDSMKFGDFPIYLV